MFEPDWELVLGNDCVGVESSERHFASPNETHRISPLREQVVDLVSSARRLKPARLLTEQQFIVARLR